VLRVPSGQWFLPLMAATGFAMSMTAPLELLYARRLGVGVVGMGVFMVTTSIGMVTLDVFGTRFVPRLEARTTMALGIAAFGVSCAVMGSATSVVVLIAGRIIQGVGAGLLFSAGLQAAVRVDGEKERALGRFNAAFLLGAALGAPIGGAAAGLVDGTAGYRVVFFACLVVSMCVAGALRVALPLLPPAVLERPEFGWPKLTGPPGLGLALALGTVGDFVRGGVVYTALPLAGESRELSTAMIGIAVGLLSAVEIAVLTTSRRALLRFGIVPCVLASLSLGVVSALLLAVAEGLTAFVVGSVLFGIVVAGATIGPPLVIVALTDEAAAGLAKFRISSGVGMMVGSTGTGVAASAVGPSVVFAGIGGVLLGGTVLAYSVGRRLSAGAPA
jgi:predicted MFS family arabinose efflux permease